MNEARGRDSSAHQGSVIRRATAWLGIVPAALLLLVSGCGSTSGATAGQGTTNGAKLVVPNHIASEFTPSQSLTDNWIQSDTQKQTVTLSVTLNANQLALNGYSQGFAEVDIPTGWQVTVHFKNNNSILPGGLMVVQPADVVSSKKAVPVFSGATMKQPYQGIGLHQTATFSFQTGSPGNYVLESAPSAVSGTWLWFVVTPKQSKAPTVLVRHGKL